MLGDLAKRWEWTDLHDFNQAMIDGEAMTNMLISNHASSQVAHDLVHIDQNPPALLWVKGTRLHMRIDAEILT